MSTVQRLAPNLERLLEDDDLQAELRRSVDRARESFPRAADQPSALQR